MMTKAYLESAIERHGEKAEIIIFARDALAYLDRSETAEAERDALAERIGFLQVERDTVWNQADTFRAERDAVTVERDELRDRASEADGKVDGLRDDLSKSRAFARGLSANIVAAEEEIDRLRERVKALVGAERERDRLLRSEADICAILGAAPDELLSDAARRVANTPAMTLLDEVRAALVVPHGESLVAKAKWVMAARAKSHEMQSEREAEIDRLRARVAELESAEAEPPQVFRVKAEVRITSTGNAEVRVCQIITDPAFYGLALRKVARLGLVVCDE